MSFFKYSNTKNSHLFFTGTAIFTLFFLLNIVQLKSANAQTRTSHDFPIIDELVLANHVLASKEVGVMDTYGIISLRNPENPNHFFISRKIAPGIVTKETIYTSDLNGIPIEKNTSNMFEERFIHAALYKNNTSTQAIACIQTPEIIAFSMSSTPLYSPKKIPNIAISQFKDESMDLSMGAVMQEAICNMLTQSDVVLIPGYGAVIIGHSLLDLVRKTTKLYENAKVQIQAAALGGDVKVLTFGPKKVDKTTTKITVTGNSANRPWEYWTKKIASQAAYSPFSTPTNSAIQEEISDLVLANRILSSADLDILGAYGHVSVRSKTNPNRYYISTDISPGIVTVHDIIENDLESKAIHDERGQYEERFIHGEIYKSRPDVMAIVHAHTSDFVAFSISSIPLRPVFNRANFMTQGLPIFDIRKYTEGGPAPVGCAHCISTPDLAHAMALELAEKPAILLYGHGIVVTGKSIADMVSTTNVLRKNAKIQQMVITLNNNNNNNNNNPDSEEITSLSLPQPSTDLSEKLDWEFWNKTLTPQFIKEAFQH